MTLTSFDFFVFFAASILCYYIFPEKYRWTVLLTFSAVFFVLSSSPLTGLYLIGCILSTHFCSQMIRKQRLSDPKRAKLIFFFGICINLVMLIILKDNGFFLLHWNAIAAQLPLKAVSHELGWAVPLGISFYTLQSIGMLTDTYRGSVEPEQNLFKTALFIAFYPQLTSGPIARYGKMRDSLFEGHRFSWTNLCHGLQRMLWGLFKKLVISARLALIVDGIYESPELYKGFYLWIAACLFMLQLYTDFSGCMDIIIGAAETYGIHLPENFRTPFFSRTVQEYWQRWHITLGAFMRDYVFYPILRSRLWLKMESGLRGKFGKKVARQIPVFAALLIVWLLTGFWHGGAYKFILGQGLWFWLCIVIGQAGESTWKKLRKIFKVDQGSFSWHLFQSLRTFVLAAIGNIFFRAGSLKSAFRIILSALTEASNPWVFFDNFYTKFGLTEKDIFLTVIALLVLLLVSCFQRSSSVREKIDRQNIVFRWTVYFLLLFSVIIFGKYGPDYNPADFIYRGF